MCTVVFVFGWREDVPLVVAANRDELLARPSEAPLLLESDPPLWGGRDQVAGGTWLAVDPAGRVGAVTNRHPDGVVPERDPARRSRGQLPLEALAGNTERARDWLKTLDAEMYNPVNVLYLSPEAGITASLDDVNGMRLTDVASGVHVITEQDLDDLKDVKAQRISREASAAASEASTAQELVQRLRQTLSSHEAADGGAPACIHGDVYGTKSSATVVVSGARPYRVRYEHADGPPCVTPYEQVL